MRYLLLLCLCLPTLASAKTLRLDGEVVAQRSQQFTPPSIPDVWMLNITDMAPDGSPIAEGDTVVTFDGGDTQNQLMQQRNQRAEKNTQREQLLLELAERERNERLATEERRARLDKAQRKATQPENLVRRVDYRKLVIERSEAEELMALAEQREALATEQRRQELRLINAEIALLDQKITTLQNSLEALKIKARQPGVMVHRSSWNGEKFAVGSRVFRGQAVAEIPDMETLSINAQVDERYLTLVSQGMRARVITESGTALDGHIAEVGRVVHSKSRVQPVPVVDVRVNLDAPASTLKPGRAVRVELQTSTNEDTAQ